MTSDCSLCRIHRCLKACVSSLHGSKLGASCLGQSIRAGMSVRLGCVQEEGPTEADVSSLRSIEQRNWENLQQENVYWQEMLTSTYMSRSYQLVSKI